MNDYQIRCKELAEFYEQAASTGKSMEVKVLKEKWMHHEYGPNLGCNLQYWRLKPSPQKAYVVWLPCDYYVKGTSTFAPPFKSLQEAEEWNNEYANGQGKIQEIVCPE
jgi:hypothetical protein